MKNYHCGAEHESAFCPTCGTRLTDNQFIGKGDRWLSDALNTHHGIVRDSQGVLKRKRREAAEILDPAEADTRAKLEILQKIQEALQYARDKKIN